MRPSDTVSSAGLEQLALVFVKFENKFWRGAVSYFIYGYPVYTLFKLSQDETRNAFYEGKRKKKRSPDGNFHLLYSGINIVSRYRTLLWKCKQLVCLFIFFLTLRLFYLLIYNL